MSSNMTNGTTDNPVAATPILGDPGSGTPLPNTPVPANQVISPAREVWLSMRSNRGAMMGLIFICLLVFCAVFADVISPHGAAEQFRERHSRARLRCTRLNQRAQPSFGIVFHACRGGRTHESAQCGAVS